MIFTVSVSKLITPLMFFCSLVCFSKAIYTYKYDYMTGCETIGVKISLVKYNIPNDSFLHIAHKEKHHLFRCRLFYSYLLLKLQDKRQNCFETATLGWDLALVIVEYLAISTSVCVRIRGKAIRIVPVSTDIRMPLSIVDKGERPCPACLSNSIQRLKRLIENSYSE